MKKVLILLLTTFYLTSCSATNPWVGSEFSDWQQQSLATDQEPELTLFIIGDTGDPNLEGPEPVFQLLEHAFSLQNNKTAIIFVGDNIYENGFEVRPPEARKISEQKLLKNLDPVKTPDVEAFFIPGNHDWWSGLEGLKAQQEFIGSYSDEHKSNITYLPRAGCPGPETRLLHESLLLITIDSEWFLMDNNEEIASEENCDISTRDDVLNELKRLSENNTDKFIVLATHHPFHSRAEHANNYTWQQHIFPLLALNNNLWIPLPVVGSLYPVLHKQFGSNQDFTGNLNKAYRQDVLKQFENHPKFISAAGHDHNLQYFRLNDMHQVVSGAGTKTDFVVKGGKAGFLLADYGFAALHLYESGALWIEFWTTQFNNDENPVFRYPIDSLYSGESH